MAPWELIDAIKSMPPSERWEATERALMWATFAGAYEVPSLDPNTPDGAIYWRCSQDSYQALRIPGQRFVESDRFASPLSYMRPNYSPPE